MPAVDGLVRNIHVATVRIFEDAIPYVVVVGHEPGVRLTSLLR
jgi:hypothetical protein